MTPWTPRAVLAAVVPALALAAALPGSLVGQGRGARTSIVIVTGQEAPMPIPTLMEGPQANLANYEIADQLFLRLAGLGPNLSTSGDQGFVPRLARQWTRRDSVTLAFDLHPRARWHDGAPVTARDVIFTFERARNERIAPKLATLLRSIESVTAEGNSRVVFRFSHPYAEQMYDAIYHVAPLPAHLLASLPPEEVRRSSFVARPVGSGPYRWVRSVAGQFVELAAFDQFFLGRPQIARVIVRVASDPDARLNLVLSGQADAMDNIPPPLGNLKRVAANPELRLVTVPSPTIGFLLFNQRAPGDRSRPHPILSDLDVRKAIILALDRPLLVKAVFGSHGEVPYGPASPLFWIRRGAPQPLKQDREKARRLLAGRGWTDHDGDGILDRDGRPLSLRLNLPNTSAIRRQMALLLQEQLRQAGVHIELQHHEGPVWNERRSAGQFDIDFSATTQDPSPSSLIQSWSCEGGTNVARFCDPTLDTLLDRAILGRGDALAAWHAVLRRIEEDAPAAFLYAPSYVFAVNRRFENVTIRPESSWIDLWQWSAGPEVGRSPAGY